MSTVLVGNISQEPELRFTGEGTPVTSFSMAVNKRVKKGDEWEDKLMGFFRVTCWRKLAENVAESLKKGHRVIVVGDVEVRQYDKDDGSKGTSVEIQATAVGPELTFHTAELTKVGSGS